MRNLTLIRKNLFRRKLRLILLLLSIMVAFLLYGLLTSVQRSFVGGDDTQQANRLIVTNKINFTQPLPISYFDRVRRMKGVAAATHASWFGGYYQQPRNFLIVYASDIPSYFRVYPELAMPQRQYADCLANRTGLLVGKSLADQYGWRVGQNIALNSNIFQQLNGSRAWTFTLCGIFTDSKARGGDKVVLFHYDYFNETRSFGRDSIGLVALLTDDASHNQAVADAINREFANSAAEVDTVTEQQFAAAFLAQLGDIGLIVTLVVGAAFLTIIMIVGSSFALTVRERTREIGILKALGFSGRRISLIVVGEAIIIAAVGGLVGLALAQISVIGLSYSGQLSTLSMGWTIWLSGIGWILLLGLLTAGIPVYRAFHVNTVTALGKR